MRNKQTGEFMKRSRLYRLNQNLIKRNAVTYRRNSLLAAATLGLLFGLIVAPTIYKWINPPMLDPKGTVIDIKPIEVKAIEIKCDYDPITYIRCRGEQLGYSNKVITTAIRIARAESNFRPMAKNPTSTATGIFQFINSTWHSYCKGKNIYDFKDNIDCFYKVYAEQTTRYAKKCLIYDFNDWNASKAVWNN